MARTPSGLRTRESGHYLSANRNKRSLTVNFAKPEGAALIRRLLPHCDVLIEHFKVGGLAKYGLSYDQGTKTGIGSPRPTVVS